MSKTEHLAAIGKATQFKPGVSGNPAGKPKGVKHINTHIQELLNDDKFTTQIQQGYNVVDYKGAPLKAILAAQVNLALNSKDEGVRIKATELLLKHGWSQKIEQETTGEQTITVITRNAGTLLEEPTDDDT